MVVFTVLWGAIVSHSCASNLPGHGVCSLTPQCIFMFRLLPSFVSSCHKLLFFCVQAINRLKMNQKTDCWSVSFHQLLPRSLRIFLSVLSGTISFGQNLYCCHNSSVSEFTLPMWYHMEKYVCWISRQLRLTCIYFEHTPNNQPVLLWSLCSFMFQFFFVSLCWNLTCCCWVLQPFLYVASQTD